MMSSRIVYITRLSAIGDLIIASSFIKQLSACGYFPILITHQSLKDVAHRIVGLQGFMCIDTQGALSYFLKGEEVGKSIFVEYLKNLDPHISKHNQPFFVDLQRTNRSKKAFRILKKELNLSIEKKFFIPKRTLYRIFLLICAWVLFSQKKRRSQNLTPLRISQIQEELLYKICTKDKSCPAGPDFLLSLSRKNQNSYANSPCLKADPAPLFDIPTSSYICLFPGSSGFIKSWPKESFRRLIQILLEKTNYTLFVCGGQDEIRIGEYLCFPENPRLVNLVGKHSLDKTLPFIAHASFVVSNDSFAGHAAAAYGVPGAVIFGPTTPLFGFLPPHPPITTLYANLKCSPCSRHGKNACRYKNLKCMTEITPEEVYDSMTHIYPSSQASSLRG
jgi:ADP-heptose:LPS heptosyltransferase